MNASPYTDEQAILDLVQDWARATTAGDYNALEPLMHPDVVFLTAGNEPMNRDAFRDNFLNIVKTMQLECTVDTREVEVSGELGYAWNWITVCLKNVSEDIAASRQGFAMSVYKRSAEGRWQLWRDANLMSRQSS